MNKQITLQDVRRLAEGRVSDLDECDRIFEALEQSPALHVAYEAFLSASDDATEPAEEQPATEATTPSDADYARFGDFVRKFSRSRLLPVVGGGQPLCRLLTGETTPPWKGLFSTPDPNGAVEFAAVREADGRVRFHLAADAPQIDPLGLVLLDPAFLGQSFGRPTTSTKVVTAADNRRWAGIRGRDVQLAARGAGEPRALAADDAPRSRRGLYQIHEPRPEPRPGEYLIAAPRREVAVDWVVVEFHAHDQEVTRANLFLTADDSSDSAEGPLEGTVVRPDTIDWLTHVRVRSPERDDLARLAPAELSTLMAHRQFRALPVTRVSAHEFAVTSEPDVHNWLAKTDNLVVGLRAVISQEVK